MATKLEIDDSSLIFPNRDLLSAVFKDAIPGMYIKIVR